jgi:sulfonate transport system permease protein
MSPVGAHERFLRAAWLPALLGVSWEIAARQAWIDALFFPPPTAILAKAIDLARAGEMMRALGETLAHLAAGYAAGTLAGTALGVLLGTQERVRHSTEGIVAALSTTPKIVLLPMLMLLMGPYAAAGIAVVAISCAMQLTIQLIDSIRHFGKHYPEMACNYGAGRWMVLRDVYVPALLPQMFTALRVALGIGLIVTISVELAVTEHGLGGMIIGAWRTFAVEKLYVGVFLASITGALCHLFLRLLQRRFSRWLA